MVGAIAALLALGLAVPSTTARSEARTHNAKRKKAHKPPAPPLAGAAKTQAIAEATGLENLTVRKVYNAGVDELSPDVDLLLRKAFVFFRSGEPPVVMVHKKTQVQIDLPGKPRATYFVDCGVDDAVRIDHFVIARGGKKRGLAPVSGGRVFFAHTIDSDLSGTMTISLRDEQGDTTWEFQGCEITELAPALKKLAPSSTGTVAK